VGTPSPLDAFNETVIFQHPGRRNETTRNHFGRRLQRSTTIPSVDIASLPPATFQPDDTRHAHENASEISRRHQTLGDSNLGVRGTTDIDHQLEQTRRAVSSTQHGVHQGDSYFSSGQNHHHHGLLHNPNFNPHNNRELDLIPAGQNFQHERRSLLQENSKRFQTLQDARSQHSQRSSADHGAQQSATGANSSFLATHVDPRIVCVPGRRQTGQLGTRQDVTDRSDVMDVDNFVKSTKVYKKKTSVTPWPKPVGEGPLYAPAVKPMNVVALTEFAAQMLGEDCPAVQDMRFVNDFLTNTAVHNAQPTSKMRASILSTSEIDTLLEAKLIEEVPFSSTTTTFAFLVSEEKKNAMRRRTIFHTIVDNDQGPTASKRLMKITSIDLLSSRVRNSVVGAGRDFQSYYHQFKWSDEVSTMFVFEVGDKKYKLTRSAMGHKNSAAAASTTTRLITQLALFLSRSQNVKYDIVIDDVLFLGKQDEVECVLGEFDKICERFDVTIGTRVPPSTEFVHRGIVFNTVTGMKQLKPAFLEKFKRRSTWYKTKPTINRAESIIGMIAYAAQVITITGLSSAFREFAACVLDRTKLSTSNFATAVAEIMRNKPSQLSAADSTPVGGTCISDATTTSTAAIFVNAFGEVTTRVSTLAFVTPIHVAEAIASIQAVQLVPPFQTAHRVECICDNTTWIHSSNLTRTSAQSMEASKQLFWSECEARKILPQFIYIESALNPADAPSRGRDVDITMLNEALRQTTWSR